MRRMVLEKEEIYPMCKGMQAYTWLQLMAGLCIIGLTLLLTACGDHPAAVSQGKATPHATATPNPGTQIVPAFIDDKAGFCQI